MTTLSDTERILIKASSDIVDARKRGRERALRLGFTLTESTLVATAISELGRNMVLYAKGGEIVIGENRNSGQRGITIIAQDSGPGIKDLQRALAGRFSTSGGLGLGLSGVRRLMDTTEVFTELGKGTKIIATLWLP